MSGGKILAHSTAGHLSLNPDVRIYDIRAGQQGGDDIAPIFPARINGKPWTKEQSAEFRRLYMQWRGVLHKPNGRWDVLGMSKDQLYQLIQQTAPYVPGALP
jgi:hypothetical protein